VAFCGHRADSSAHGGALRGEVGDEVELHLLVVVVVGALEEGDAVELALLLLGRVVEAASGGMNTSTYLEFMNARWRIPAKPPDSSVMKVTVSLGR
jgi:hypothetical protein